VTGVTHAEMSGYIARVTGVTRVDMYYFVTIKMGVPHANTSVSVVM
jgi:hypothetical protein